MRRVVVTGIGGVTALGNDWPGIRARLERGETAIRYMAEWERFDGINTRLAAPVLDFAASQLYPRKKTRTMGRVAGMSVYASEQALVMAGLRDDPVIQSGRTGIAYGSSFGSPPPVV
ncbi:MAG TPA: beta-ketoacyl synthase N-terminal-like domain-containing protein, partial [Terriglobales bacterium]|nr:beta-ketoacyl synthase N-terminal-like domain-containing protein [Terriglobales bacterium]